MLLGVLLVVAFVVYGTTNENRSAASPDDPTLTDNRENIVDMRNSPKLTIVSSDGLRSLRNARDAGANMTDALASASDGGAKVVAYEHSAHYLGFITAYLRDEEKLPDRDWELGDAFFEERKRITDVLPRAGVDLDALRVENYDLLELRREFHAGGPLTDPEAEAGLQDALRVLRENLSQIDEDGALIVAY